MTANRKRKLPGEWKPIILAAGLVEARAGLAAVTLRGVARRCGISHKQVAIDFECIDNLRECIAAEALRIDDRAVIGRLVIDKHPAVENLPGDARARYVAGLMG